MPINEALAEYLDLYHKGEANAVTSRELECAFRMRGSELRRETVSYTHLTLPTT